MSKQPTDKGKQSNVKVLRPVANEVIPHDGWQLNCQTWGYMGIDATQAGRLVRLADVVRWIQSARSLPRGEAVDLLCEAITPEAMASMFKLRSTEYAQPIPSDCTFGYSTEEQAQAAKIKNASKQREAVWAAVSGRPGARVLWSSKAIQVTSEPGVPALAKRLRAEWQALKLTSKADMDSMDDKRGIAAHVAILIIKAHELWGYGAVRVEQAGAAPANADQVATYADLVALRSRDKGALWTPATRGILARECADKNGERALRKRIAKDLGVSVTRVGELIREHIEESKAKDKGGNQMWSPAAK